MKLLHDDYCSELVDSFVVWKSINMSDDQIKEKTFDIFLINKMSISLNLTKLELENQYREMDFTRDNFTTWGHENRSKFNKNDTKFSDDLEAFINLAFESNYTEVEVNNGLDELREKYRNNNDFERFNMAIDVSRSSIVIWKNKINIMTNSNLTAGVRDPCAEVARNIAGGDAWGAIWGSWGGLAGQQWVPLADH